MRKYLKIAVTAEVKALVEEPWETVLLSEKLNGAELACIAFMKNDAEAMKIAEKIKANPKITAIIEPGAIVEISAPPTAPRVVAISRNIPNLILATPSLTYAAAEPEEVAITDTKAAPIA